jgi:hypothetical protein
MCEKCNGTHIVHEFSSFGYRTSCCPECGSVSDEEWYAGINSLQVWVEEMRNKELAKC